MAKLADLAGSLGAVVGFGVPERLAGVVGVGLPVCELSVAVALLVSGSARFGALGALVLLSVFVVAIAVGLARGTQADCHCFGQLHSARVGWQTLLRNGVLAALAGFVVLEGWHGTGVSATAWIAKLDAAAAVGIPAGLLLAAVIGFLAWFSLQILRQNGRMLARLEVIEAAIDGLPELALPDDGPGSPASLGSGLGSGGLAVGSPAPEFTLPSLDGEPRSLGWLLSDRRPLLLVFSDAGCGPCEALLPEVAGWQRDHEELLVVAVIASGDPERNRAKAARHGLERVVLQSEREVSDVYRAPGTPMAVVIGADGLIQSPMVGGVDAIRALVAQATAPRVAVVQVPASNGHGESDPPPGASRVGQPAPELVLADLDGHRFALRDLSGRTLAIFWNPGCGFCQQMLADLKALERDPPANGPRLVVISSGDPEQTREHGLRSQVMVDPEGRAMNAFGAHGTPMGVMIENGRIASAVAAGADAVLELVRSAPRAELIVAVGEGNHNGSHR